MPQSPKKKALVVGINDYGGTGRNNLPSCVNDAKSFSARILQGRFGFAPQDIRQLFNAEATVAAFEGGLDWLTQEARSGDSLVLYFSGHGFTREQDGAQEEYIVLREPGEAGPELYLDNRFVAKVKDLPEGVFTAVLDMCYSGGGLKALPPLPAGPPAMGAGPVMASGGDTWEPPILKTLPYPEQAMKALSRAEALAGKADPSEAGQAEMSGLLVSACLEVETAAASTPKTKGLSAFTFGLIEALEGIAGPCSAEEALHTALGTLRNLGFQQTPMLLEREVPGNLKTRPFISSTVFLGSHPGASGADLPIDDRGTGKGLEASCTGMERMEALMQAQLEVLSRMAEELRSLRLTASGGPSLPDPAMLRALVGALASPHR